MNELNNYKIGDSVEVEISYGIMHYGQITSADSGHPLELKDYVRVSGIGDPVSISNVKPLVRFAWDGIYRLGYNAYSGISHEPEKRGRSIVDNYYNELNETINTLPEEEKDRYFEGYKKHLTKWLTAKSRCLSVMITGGSNFPVARNEKNNRYEHNASVEFSEWRENALKAIKKRIEQSKSPEIKMSEEWTRLKSTLIGKMETIIEIDTKRAPYSRPLFVSSITGIIGRYAKNGDVEMVINSLELIREWNGKVTKPIITTKNTVWELEIEAKKKREAEQAKQEAEPTESVINGVRVVENAQMDRIQLFFDGKPEQSVISKLKSGAFRWSPSQGCWQRQLTPSGIYAAKTLVNSLA